MLALIIAFPAIAALLLCVVPARDERLIARLAVAAGVVWFALMLGATTMFHSGTAEAMQLEMHGRYLDLGSSGALYYHLGADGISMPLLLLTGLLMLVSLIYSAATIHTKVKSYFILFLLLGTGLAGTFLALDLFLFYIFWELAMIPMYFLIGIWGGPRRQYAAIKFFIYTTVGSLCMLLAIIYLYFQSGQYGARTDDIVELMARGRQGHLAMGTALILCFWGFALAFAVKVPAFPLHTWLPDAHVEAPTAGSVMLAGAMLKMGTYGLARISLGLFPRQSCDYAMAFLIVGLIGLIYGSLCALAQTDMKKMIAYSSVGHMGFVLLGIGAAACILPHPGLDETGAELARITALDGAILQMVNHGLITGALFLLVGVIYERAHHRDIRRLGGLFAIMPVFSGFFLFMGMASLGLPGLAGFWGEFFVLSGTFQLHPAIGAVAVIGVILTAAYFLLLVQRTLMGPVNEENGRFLDLSHTEKFCIYPLAALILLLGLWPRLLLEPVNDVSRQIVRSLRIEVTP